MIRKFFCRRSESEDQCVVQKTENQKTFSSFVDQVTDDFPGTLPLDTFPALPVNPNNPYDVLQNIGLLNIPGSCARTGCCPSNVKLNFYAEESDGDGRMRKVFQSDHHIENGKLVYSSTQEVIPDRTREFKRSSRCEVNERKTLSAGAGTRHGCNRNLSSINLCNIKDENHERYLHTLTSQNIQRQCSPRNRPLPPKSFKYLASYQRPSKINYPENSQLVKTSSKISICSKEAYSSPNEHTVKVLHREENCIKTALEPLPPPRFRRDLFVIPKHTCRTKIPIEAISYKTQKSSHRDTVHRRDASPSFKHKTHCKIVDSPTAPRHMEETEISRIASPHEKYVKFSPQHRVRYVDDSTKVRKQKHHKEHKEDPFYGKIGLPCYQVYAMHTVNAHEDKNKSNSKKHDKQEHSIKEPFVQETKVRETVVTASDDEYESEDSSRTLPFTTTTDTEGERELKKSTHKHRKMSERGKESKILNGKSETKREHASERNVRRRRQIDPNKVVHIEDTGKRFSQHYSDGNVTIDSDKVFGDEKKFCSSGNCGKSAPKRSGCPNLTRNNSEAYEETFIKGTIGDHLKHVEGINDHKIQAEIIRNVVNNEALEEYRRKYTKCLPCNKAEGENFEWKSTVKKEYSKKTYVPKHCEACAIERFWAD